MTSLDGKIKVNISPLGATMTDVLIRGGDDEVHDIVLGFGRNQYYKYFYRSPYFGSIVGRVANRIGDARFSISCDQINKDSDSQNLNEVSDVYHLNNNDNENSLHGGEIGFDRKVWQTYPVYCCNNSTCSFDEGVMCMLRSHNGEEGYPGNLNVKVKYLFRRVMDMNSGQQLERNALYIEMLATSDSCTPVNLAQHTYWNLNGHEDKNMSIKNHLVAIRAEQFTPVDKSLIPTGILQSVDSTAFDLRPNTFKKEKCNNISEGDKMYVNPLLCAESDTYRAGTSIGDALENLALNENVDGFDHNFVIDKKVPFEDCYTMTQTTSRGDFVTPEGLFKVASVRKGPVERGGEYITTRDIKLEVFSDQPGVQYYTGNFLDGIKGKYNQLYRQHAGLCLETQAHPDSVNKNVEYPTIFPNILLQPNKAYRHRIVYVFTTD